MLHTAPLAAGVPRTLPQRVPTLPLRRLLTTFLFALAVPASPQTFDLAQQFGTGQGSYGEGIDVGDYDHDGDLDLALVGMQVDGLRATRIFRNDGGIYTDIQAGLTGLIMGAAAWGDYDNDSDLDLLVTGDAYVLVYPGTPFPYRDRPFTRLYRNDGNDTFVDSGITLPALDASDAAWADYDGDGDVDLLLTGSTTGSSSSFFTGLYRNEGGAAFTDSGVALPPLRLAGVAWGDYDGDGDSDLFLGGISPSGVIARIFRNDAGQLVDLQAGLPGVYWASASWGDYDGDGDLDLVFSGTGEDYQPSICVTRLMRNDAGAFVDTGSVFPDTSVGFVAWGDADNDGDLDLLTSPPVLYRNDAGQFTSVPTQMLGKRYASGAWLDFDQDGDLDVVITTGWQVGSPVLLYANTPPPDTVPPVVHVPPAVTAEATHSAGAVVWYTATAEDAVDPAPLLSCEPPSGSLFAIGVTSVTCTASDASGNTASASFTLTVSDGTAPELALPAPISVEAISASGAVVNYAASAVDAVDGPVPVVCSPASGSTFPLGVSTVGCLATDSAGNPAAGSFTVTVSLITPPLLDDFNRADGELGANWTGFSDGLHYLISGEAGRTWYGGPIYWSLGEALGTSQAAFLTFRAVTAAEGLDNGLLLKVQSDPVPANPSHDPDWIKGTIGVSYDAVHHKVYVSTWRPSSTNWKNYARQPLTMADGDVFAARALANGTIEVYRNDTLAATFALNATDQAFFNGRGGRIGLWFEQAATAEFDDFGGGTLAR